MLSVSLRCCVCFRIFTVSGRMWKHTRKTPCLLPWKLRVYRFLRGLIRVAFPGFFGYY